MAQELKTFLERMAGEVAPSLTPRSDMFRRARLRRIRNLTAAGAIVGVIAFGSLAGVRAFIQPAPVVPAQPGACSWQVVPSPNENPSLYGNTLTKLTVVSSNDVWSIGTFGRNQEGAQQRSLILHWDGTTWTNVPHPEPGSGSQLYDIAAASSTDVWAVGTTSDAEGNGPHGLIEHWDGTTWSVIPAVDPGSTFWHFEGVATAGPDDVWAVGNTATGDSGGTLIEHWDGNAWAIVASPAPQPRPLSGEPYSSLDAVTTVSAEDAWAVGEVANVAPAGASNTLVEHWDGNVWSVISSPDVIANDSGEPFDHLLSVAANSPSDVWAVGIRGEGAGIEGQGDHTLVEHWDGQSWQVAVTADVGTWNRLHGVAVWSGGALVVGSYQNESGGTPSGLIEQWDGTSWKVVENPAGSAGRLYGVAAVPSDGAWAVGSSMNGQTLTLRCQ
jgi:hypothetical protein